MRPGTLYRPTRTAVRFNPLLKVYFDRPVGAGEPKAQPRRLAEAHRAAPLPSLPGGERDPV